MSAWLSNLLIYNIYSALFDCLFEFFFKIALKSDDISRGKE